MISQEEKELLQHDDVAALYKSHTKTDGAKKLYDTLEPLTNEAAKLQVQEINELKDGIINQLAPDFSLLFPISDLVDRASKMGILTLDEIYRCSMSLGSSNRLHRFFKANSQHFPLSARLAGRIVLLESEEKELTESISENVELNTGKYPAVGKLQKEIHSLQNEIKSTLNKLVHDPDYKDHLQESLVTTQGNKYVVLLKASSRGKVKGSIVDTSSSGATFYFEPASVGNLNAKLLSKENDLHAEIYRILKQLSWLIGNRKNELKENLAICDKLDFLFAAAKASTIYNYNSVSYSDKPLLELYNLRHPLLEADSDVAVVSNSISLGGKSDNGIIITGANTGGKTVLLKSIALLVLFARYGLPVPVGPDSLVGSFSKIAVDIGDDQNLEKSLSTFSGQIVSVNRMLESSDESSLIIIDEIISGTNPRHAAALAMSVLEYFEQKKARVIISTHYPELKEFATKSSYYNNASVSFDVSSLKPTYRLSLGTPGTSYAFEIARTYNMKEEILINAAKHLSENEIISEETIERVNSLETELFEKEKNISKLENSLQKQRENYYVLNKKLREKIETVKEESTIAYIQQLESWKKEILEKVKTANDALNKDANTSQAYSVIAEIDGQKNEVLKKAEKFRENRLTSNYRDFEESKVSIGDRVFLTSLEKEGVILELYSQKKEALIGLGPSMKTRFPFDKLKLTEHYKQTQIKQVSEPGKSAKAIRHELNEAEETTVLTLQTDMNTVDLRGQRVDEAIQQLDLGIDRLIQNGLNAGVIIHGHGTGALKEAVRNWISHSFQIKSARPGQQNEGGDGVTIIYI